jgi:succinate dehydrogenase / fumarate reductase cytochrome b subunit
VPDERTIALARRVFSLTGVVPLGAFLVVHAVANASAVRSEGAFAATVRAFDRVPAIAMVEALVVFLPLAVHASIGLWLAALVAARRPLSPPSPYPRGVGIAMRATGVLVLAFLVMHLPEIRFRTPGTRQGGAELLAALAWDLSSTWHGVPWRGALYLGAAGCVAFHFAAGLWGVLAPRWKGAGGRDRRLRLATAWGAGAFGALLWLMLADAVVLHATGTPFIGLPAPDPASSEPCPAPSAP